jgi:hypothetical protein
MHKRASKSEKSQQEATKSLHNVIVLLTKKKVSCFCLTSSLVLSQYKASNTHTAPPPDFFYPVALLFFLRLKKIEVFFFSIQSGFRIWGNIKNDFERVFFLMQVLLSFMREVSLSDYSRVQQKKMLLHHYTKV